MLIVRRSPRCLINLFFGCQGNKQKTWSWQHDYISSYQKTAISRANKHACILPCMWWITTLNQSQLSVKVKFIKDQHCNWTEFLKSIWRMANSMRFALAFTFWKTDLFHRLWFFFNGHPSETWKVRMDGFLTL